MSEMENRVASETEQDRELLRLLRTIEVPEPGDDFEARMLQKVIFRARADRARKIPIRPSFPHLGWLPLSAALLCAVFISTALYWAGRGLEPATQLQEAAALRPVHILLQSPRDMPGATIRVTLPDNVGLDGYERVRTLQWRADIFAGENRLSLPVRIGASGEVGEIRVEVEYRGARKSLHLPVATGAVTRT
ncbi:hypothetical protein [Microbulbifer thermotolerans]|uniref:hypothetical protein n=1 Tax=Microbulbifer thermotolerans TaxID=252514 RepID=UPI002248CF53|nr:hypothetical protein [Microbulbifer thermotolerans]MCX2832876.1 hypothetical protein [Microbulbifer thermotolerans]